MRWFALAGLAGCGLPKCEELCAAQTACVQGEIDQFGSTWPQWTGFEDRRRFEQGCLSVFEKSRESGAPRSQLQDTCRTDLERDPCAGPTD